MSRVGIFAGMYVNIGTYEAPEWMEIDLLGDAAVNPGWEEGDATTRESFVNMAEPTKMNLEITGRVRVPDDDNEVFDTLEDAFISKELLDIMALNAKKDTPNARGWRFFGKVFTWTEDQALGNVLFKDMMVKPSPGGSDDPKVVRATDDGSTLNYLEIGVEPGSE